MTDFVPVFLLVIFSLIVQFFGIKYAINPLKPGLFYARVSLEGGVGVLYYRDRPHFVIIRHTRHQSNALLFSFVFASRGLFFSYCSLGLLCKAVLS